MKLEEFEDALDRLGPDLGRWPGDLAARARVLVSDDPQAAKIYATHQALAAVLDLDPAPRLSAGLVGRIIAGAQAARPTPSGFLTGIWKQVGLLIAAGGLGLSVGLVQAADTDEEFGADDVFSIMVDIEGDDYPGAEQ